MATYNIGGIDLTNDASGIRSVSGRPIYDTGMLEGLGYDKSWGGMSQALKMGDTRALIPELRPYASQLGNLNDQIASTENYDTGFGAGKWVPGAILGIAGAGLWGDLGGSSWLSNLFGGTDPSWGVNAVKEATGAGMDLPLVDDWSNWMSDFGTGESVSGYFGTNPTELAQAAATYGSGATDVGLLKTIKDATGLTGKDLLGLAGKLGAAGLGAYGSSQQAKSLSELANKYSEYGAPSRARFEASMTPGFDPMTIPGYAGALDTTSKSLLAKLSATGGNPFGNPGGLIDANKQIVAGTALPAINEYQRLNLSAGGLGNLNAAVPSLQTGAIQSQGSVLDALGYGLNAIANPQPSLAELAKALSGYDLKYGF